MAKVDSAAPASRQRLSSRRRSWLFAWSLIRLLIVVPLWLFGLVALLLGVALSPWGTSWLFSQGESRGYISYDHQEGALLDSFALEGFELTLGGTRASIDELSLSWADDCLLNGRLCLDSLQVSGADIRLTSPNDSEPPPESNASGPLSIYLPFPIELRDVAINDSRVELADGTRIAWEQFSTSAFAALHEVRFAPTELIAPTLYVPPSPGSQLASPTSALSAEAIDAAVAATRPADTATEKQALAGSESATDNESTDASSGIALPDITLPIDVKIEALTVTDFAASGAFEYQVERLLLQADGTDSDIHIATLEVLTPDAQASLSGSATLSGDYPLSAQLQSELYLPDIMPELNGETVELELSGSLAALEAQLVAEGEVAATLEAKADLLDPDIPFEARLTSERLQWPLGPVEDTETPPYEVQSLTATVGGNMEAYQASMSLSAQGPQVPATQINLTGQGDRHSFRWAPLTLGVDDSSLRSDGVVDWSAPLSIDASVQLDQFNPGHFVAGLDGNLSGDIDLGVVQRGQRWDLTISQLAIEGQLQEYPLNLDAQLTANSNLEVDIEELLFTQGENRLTASGQLNEDAMSLKADIDMRQLHTLHSELAGALTGEIRASGRFDRPTVTADLTGERLRFATNRVAQLSLEADVRGLEDPRLEVALDMQQVNTGGQALDEVRLALSGTLSQHRLELTAQGADNSPLERARLALDGHFNQRNQRYQGQLTPLEVDGEFGNVRLEEPLEFRYDLAAGQGRLGAFCLRREQGGVVCSEEPISASAEQGRGVLSVREVPMEMLEPFLPEQWRLKGDTTADMVVAWRQGGARWQADLDIQSDVAITAINDYGQPVDLPAINLDAQVQANQAQADADITLSLSQAGELTLRLGIEDPLGRGTLDGELRANNVSLAPYRPMIVGMDRLEGGFNGSVQVSGTTAKPDLQGELALRNISINGPDIPVDVQDGEVVVAFEGEQGSIDGFIAAERGRLNIDGEAYWPSGDNWRIGIDLEAIDSPLLVAVPQFGRLEAAPDIRIRVTPERLQVRGNVDIPWARLSVGDISSSAVTPSTDEVIITERDDREAEQLAQQRAANGDDGPSAADELANTGMEMDVLITLTLGSDMQFSAYGLESGLSGTLEIRQDSGALQLFGEVNLVDGRFKAFGQDLLIRRGQLLFSGPPGLPVLDFEAIRNPEVTEDDVIAGIRVTGNAEEPNVAIFSEPAMDETRALSYVLRGRAPDASGGGVDSALTTALIGMSLGRTGGAVGSIGEAFGIDDLTLDTTGAGDDSQVALSGQLTDDLRISYGVGIFSPIAELTLRYTLLRNLYLQAVSGANQAVDLIYTFTLPGDPFIFKGQ